MTGVGPTSQRPPTPAGGPDEAAPPAPVNPAVERANRLSFGNMVRSLLPLVVICLLIVAWTTLRQDADESPVREIDPSSTVQLAANRASYQLLVPEGLDEGYRATSARTDAGEATDGDPVTLQIGYVTPQEEFAGFVVSDDRRADPVATVLDDAAEEGTVDVAGQPWTRSTTERGETALSREDAGVVVVVSGSAAEDELAEVAAAVAPYRG